MNRMRRFMRTLPGGERGQALLFSVAIIMVFFAVGLVAIDASMWLVERRDHQNDADAAAFAGAQELLNRNTDADMTARAVQKALEWGARNSAPEDTFVNGTPAVVDSCWGAPAFDGLPDGVTIRIKKQGGAFFARLWDLVAPDVGAGATVCVGSLTRTSGLRPWAIPILTSNCFETDVETGARLPLFGQICRIRSDQPQMVGSVNLNDDDDADAACGSGSSSAAAYRYLIINGTPALCSIGDIISTKQGLATGPTLQGLRDLLASEGDCDRRYDDPPGGAVDRGNGATRTWIGGDRKLWIDDFWEVFTPADAVPSPDTVYTPRPCDPDSEGAVTEPESPRFVPIILVDELPACCGTENVVIKGFAGFFIERCERWDSAGNYVPSDPEREAKCDLPAPVSQFHIIGRFIQYVELGGPAGALDPFGSKVIVLVE